jgi:hypothetical protein
MKIYYLIYQLTNKVNGKIYIGCHFTKNKDDSYMGSGRRLGFAKRKYGIEAFEKKILFECDSMEEMLKKEAELVNVEFLDRKDVYNLTLGGGSGWYHCNNDPTNIAKRSWQWVKAHSDKLKSNPEYRKRYGESLSKAFKARVERGEVFISNGKGFLGKTHSEETKQKMRKPKNQGESNSQFGSCWVFDPEANKATKIKKDEVEKFLSDGYRLGRK